MQPQPINDERMSRERMRRSPLIVGRDDLLALAQRRRASAASGAGQMLFLAGESGIGKSRLLAEIAEQAAGDGFLCIPAQAFPDDAEVAGGLLLDLSAALRRSNVPSLAEAGSRIEVVLRDSPERGGDAHRRRRLMVSDVTEALASTAAGPDPVLLAVEDLHWADDLTLDVLERLARRLTASFMLLIGTYRSDELYPQVPMRQCRARLLRQRLAEEARLSRLDREQTLAMSAAIAQTVLPSALSTMVYERSDGIPLHIEELLVGGGDQVPDTLADAVLGRVHGLSASAKTLVQAASVIGRSFDIDLVMAACALAPAVIDAGLGELADRYIIRPRGDGLSYDFHHALIRDAVYADLPPHRRRDLHARVAESAVAAELSSAFISDQYERAHQPALAYRHAVEAAAEAASMSAHRESVVLYRRAQRTMPAQMPAVERARLLAALAEELAAADDNVAAAADYDEAYRLYRDIGRPIDAAAVVPQLVAVRHLLGADLSERTGLLQQALSLLDSAPEHPDADAVRARLFAALSAAYMLDRRLDEAIGHGERARMLTRSTSDQAALLNIDATLGSVLVFAGRMDEGWPLLRDAVDQAVGTGCEAEAARAYRMIGTSASVLVEYDLAARRLTEGIRYAERTQRWNDHHYMAAHLAHVRWAAGDWAAADRLARQADADGQASITTRITARHVLGYLGLGRGDWVDARAFLHEALQWGEQMRELQRLSPALWGLAEVELRDGRFEQAIGWCEQGYRASARVDDAAYLFPYVVTGTRAYLGLDDLTGARGWLRKVERLLMLRGIPGTLPSLPHAHALIELALGHTGKARAALERASAGWDERHRFWEGTQALADLARCANRSRRPTEAARLAARARDRAAQAGSLVLLAEIGTGFDRGSAELPGGPLTAREWEVARLVATGATNRQIAVKLSIAPKTVAAHVEHILAKLGASRRTEIAVWATSSGAASAR